MLRRLRQRLPWGIRPSPPSLEQQFVSAVHAWFARDGAELRLWQRRPLRLQPQQTDGAPTLSVMSDVPSEVVTLSIHPTAGGGHEVRASFEHGFVPQHVSAWPPPCSWWAELTRMLCR